MQDAIHTSITNVIYLIFADFKTSYKNSLRLVK